MAALHISRPKVYDLIRSRDLVSFTVGRARRVTAEALTDYIRRRIEEQD
jgi:excisionase family DNA binding protein